MSDTLLKLAIQTALKALGQPNFPERALALFDALGYNTSRQSPFPQQTYAYFKETFIGWDAKFNETKALTAEWRSVDLLFQLSKAEVAGQQGLFDTHRVDNVIIESYLFFAVELAQADYTRTALAQITREINKLFPMPVMIVFKHGAHVTISVIDRRLNKKDSAKDVLEKVTFIKDISVESPHRAHIEILFDLSFAELRRVHKFTNFVELHTAWQKTLDTKELNKRFYRELSNWYFWAVENVSFPNDVANDKDNQVFNSENVIRLLTRLIFIWFIKEKNLIPERIFDEREVKKLLKGFREKGSTVYYRAVLQNLFFATLNQKIEARAFATDGSFEENKINYGIKNLYRYAADFTVSPAEVIRLFAGVPFLNGGLFDCLDSEDKTGRVIYLDGFSRNPKKQARIPDALFFAKEQSIDLSAVYDDKKRQNEKVKGLFEIFNHYKFTVVENTPIEEEVALDPELLGRVFENLLASYNPETQTTARKQTGSFYTPREIVNYMVDESLKAYLKQKLEAEAGMKPADAEVGLEFLLGYNEKEHLFDPNQTTVLINAIDSVKILDPACGSGAFPMGILHKLVHILHKLDPQNKRWKERQLEKAMALDDAAIRDNLIDDIETAFANNELDYGRKLYLIENCIYGVDIQPIATQISKLRFFISLIVDQKADKTRDNFGIRPLPNLETKFVAANTLIGIEKPQVQMSLFDSGEVKTLEAQLKDVRHRLFSAKSPADKRKLRADDQTLREKMGVLLVANGWGNQSARLLAGWDPYDQHTGSPFFDPQWMFGLSDGFDVVIGNPPYHQLSKDESASETYKLYLKARYKTSGGRLNTFIFFIFEGYNLIKQTGNLIYIIPNTLLTQEYYKDTRSFLLQNSHIDQIIHYPTMQFENAIVENITIQFSKTNIKSVTRLFAQNKEIIEKTGEVDFYKTAKAPNYNLNVSDNYVLDKIDKQGFILLEELCEINQAIALKGDKELSLKNSNPKGKFYKLLDGRNINKYKIHWGGVYLEYNLDRIHSCKRKDIFQSKEKLMFRRVSSNLIFTYDSEQFFALNTIVVLNKKNDEVNLKCLLGVLNSSLLNYYYKEQFKSTKTVFSEIQARSVGKLPICAVNKQPIVAITGYLIHIGKTNFESRYFPFFETIIDAMVYELYFPNEIKAVGCEILKHLTNLPELPDNWSDEKKLATIEQVYKELSNPAHPVSIAMEKQKTVPEVRIIEGLDK